MFICLKINRQASTAQKAFFGFSGKVCCTRARFSVQQTWSDFLLNHGSPFIIQRLSAFSVDVGDMAKMHQITFLQTF